MARGAADPEPRPLLRRPQRGERRERERPRVHEGGFSVRRRRGPAVAPGRGPPARQWLCISSLSVVSSAPRAVGRGGIFSPGPCWPSRIAAPSRSRPGSAAGGARRGVRTSRCRRGWWRWPARRTARAPAGPVRYCQHPEVIRLRLERAANAGGSRLLLYERGAGSWRTSCIGECRAPLSQCAELHRAELHRAELHRGPSIDASPAPHQVSTRTRRKIRRRAARGPHL